MKRIIYLLKVLCNPSLRKNYWSAQNVARLRKFRDVIYEIGYMQGYEDAQYSISDWNKPW